MSNVKSHGYTIIPLKSHKNPLFRWDVLPFCALYLIFISLEISVRERNDKVDIEKWGVVILAMDWLFPLVLLCHISLALACQWSVKVRAAVGYNRCRQWNEVAGLQSNNENDANGIARRQKIMSSWTHCLVGSPSISNANGTVSSASSGSNNSRLKIVPLEKGSGKAVQFRFEDVVFRCSADDLDEGMEGTWSILGMKGKRTQPSIEQAQPSPSQLFHRLHFPIDFSPQFYASWLGHSTVESLNRTKAIFGDNTVHVNPPPFTSLLLEQLLAPFFLFQLLCVILWSLDEYWYYAIFTLFMLVLFECTVAANRLTSLKRLRQTLRPPTSLWSYRFGSWSVVRSNTLVAGDLISLTSNDGDPRNNADSPGSHVPADVLMLRGGAVVNEAMLTGESVPQIKEAVDFSVETTTTNSNRITANGESVFDIDDSQLKRSVLFGGTVLVNHRKGNVPENGELENTPSSSFATRGVSTVPYPPDGGCTAMVLRTAFETKQGSLLRTMIHGGQANDGVNTIDTFLFILLLLVCAVASSIMVLRHGWDDPTRNRFKLVLHVIIIVTSVVPPELPMELSLAVTSSLADLVRRCAVFCTEPFRIPLAGMVDLCAFDKTGTLTSDDMVLRGIRLPSKLLDRKELSISCSDGTNCGGSDDLILPLSARENDEDDDSDDKKDEAENKNNVETVPWETTLVMVACQGLAMQRGRSSGNSGKKVLGSPGDKIIGDPLEKAVLRGSGWILKTSNTVSPPPSVPKYPSLPTLSSNPKDSSLVLGSPVTIRHRFAFSSKLKRMTVLATNHHYDGLLALTKGAPETMKPLLDPLSIPNNYDEVCRRHMGLGQRVLAMAFRNLSRQSSNMVEDYKSKGRDFIERDLIFCGLLVLDCPLKPDSADVIQTLRATGHRTVMITGDAILTAAEVARHVGIVGTLETAEKKTNKDVEMYELRKVEISLSTDSEGAKNDGNMTEVEDRFSFIPLQANEQEHESDSNKTIAFTSSNLVVVQDMVKKSQIAVCVTGDTLAKIALAEVRKAFQTRTLKPSRIDKYDTNENGDAAESYPVDNKDILLHPAAQRILLNLAPLISVFARHSPRQKEAIIAAFNGAGNVTLMCGDGTNDVGALKAAHVGISIVSVPGLEAKQRKAISAVAKIKEEERRERKKAKKKKSAGLSTATSKTTKDRKSSRSSRLEKSLKSLAETEEELAFVSLGDASVASPFTSRTMSIKCTEHILQRGRCTLLTMLQIYKILGVNCLVNALVLTKLHMVGVKQGDRQLTVVGVVIAALFLFVTRGKPLPTLSPERPPSSVLSKQALLSIAAQFLVHYIFITAITLMSTSYLDPYDPSLVPDGPFNPNILNSATFLVTVLATVNTFVINYRGRPFMENLSENKLMLRSVQICYVVLFGCATELFPPLNDLLQLSSFPSSESNLQSWSLTVEGGLNAAPAGPEVLLSASLAGIVSEMGFTATLVCLMILDCLFSYGVERLIIRVLA